MSQTMGVKDWTVLVLAATMFASSFFFNKVAVETISPLTVAAGRLALAAPIAFLLVRLRGASLPPLGRRWWPLMGLGILAAVIPHVAIAWSQLHIESGLAGIIFGIIPVLTVVFAHFMTADEKFTLARAAGVVLGLGGVVLVIGPAALTGLVDQLAGALAVLAAALSYSVGAIYVRRFAEIPPVVMNAGLYICAAVVVVPLALVFDAPWTLTPSAGAIWSVVAVAVLSTALPGVLMFWLIQRVGVTNTSLMAFVMPIVAVALGAALLGEWLDWPAFAGLGLILLGMVAVGGRLRILERGRPKAIA